MKNLIFGVKNGNYPTKGNSNSVSIAQVAIWNEYGTEDIPPRPAFRMGLEAGVKTRKKNIQAFLKNLAHDALHRKGKVSKSDTDRRLKILLTGIGQSAKAETKNLIKSGSITPGNKKSTIQRKGFDHPLYETGLLLESVDYEVTE